MKINDFYHATGIRGFIWKYIWGPFNLILAFLPLLLLNFLQFPSLLLLPFSVKGFRAYQRVTVFLVWGWWAWGVRNLVGLKVTFSGDQIPDGESAIIFCNHQGMADIIMILCLAMDHKNLPNLKWLAKDVLKYVPGLGWGMLFVESVFLKRAWADDAKSIEKTFAKIVDNDLKVQLIMFPEGTRRTPEKLAKNTLFAEKTNAQPTRHVLFPRTKGFVASLAGLGKHIDAVYSLTIGYHGKVPSLVEAIRGDIKEVDMHVRRFPISALPSSSDERKQWLKQEYYIKDRLLENFYKQDKFSSV